VLACRFRVRDHQQEPAIHLRLAEPGLRQTARGRAVDGDQQS
jgi:hypothetical protein